MPWRRVAIMQVWGGNTRHWIDHASSNIMRQPHAKNSAWLIPNQKSASWWKSLYVALLASVYLTFTKSRQNNAKYNDNDSSAQKVGVGRNILSGKCGCGFWLDIWGLEKFGRKHTLGYGPFPDTEPILTWILRDFNPNIPWSTEITENGW